jgi:hypothetical protein
MSEQGRTRTIRLRDFRKLLGLLGLTAVLLAGSYSSGAADTSTRVQLDVSKAGPRTVESQTEQVILRDYRFAWTSMAQALEFNTADPLEGPFVGAAKKSLAQKISQQRNSGLSTRYLDQSHKLQAIFYAPEGDVIELHDTVDYQLQVLDAGKAIYDERITAHYVVLMTPGADRWVIRQLQAVPRL